MAEPILELSNVSKNYGAVRALSGVSLRVRRGEVHSILGENGAGKSTALKIVNGELTPDEGEVRLGGRPTTAAERGAGDIAMVHQELMVFENMSVAENIFAGDMPRKAGGRIDFRRMHRRAAELLQLFGLQTDTRRILSQLTPGQRQIVEILRAVQSEASLLILDEPTSGLNNREAEVLLALIERLRDAGHTILYVSHRLHEVLHISDHISVLRDGQFVETLENRDLTEEDLIHRMVGRAISLVAGRARAEARGAVVFEVRYFSQSGAFEDITLQARRGEIVGVFGLEGSGAEELSGAMFGLTAASAGTLSLKGRPVHGLSPARLMAQGMSYLPANRKEAGLYMERSIADNIAAPVLERVSRYGLVDRERVAGLAAENIKRFAIRTSGLRDTPQQLSGGNQQKVMVSASLAGDPQVIVMNEPTRGVDVGAKAEVHEVIRQLAADRCAVIVFSSDLPELLRLSDRIVVLRSRRLSGEVSGEEIGEAQVMALAAGSA